KRKAASRRASVVRSTAILVIAPPSTSHHAGDSNPEKITAGLAILNTAASTKNNSVVIDSARNPVAQATIVSPTRIPARTNAGEASNNRGESQSNKTTPAQSVRGTHRAMSTATRGTSSPDRIGDGGA